ncbi:hypothetical protein ALQ65_200134 [Pseudomonas syringae pv. coriandricola]|uniref:Uncharacterized protein n=2 Tax=Pseudomonas TaxID=286 RepID=A0A3M3JA64_9PSED|nr:hypothetical protein ALQ65_200134 [Pseudomonas syringae pv. coriandricola]
MTQFSSLISSPPDRENLVFEIWSGTEQLAEVSREPGRPVEFVIFPTADGRKWHFKLEEFMTLMDKAVKKLQQTS